MTAPEDGYDQAAHLRVLHARAAAARRERAMPLAFRWDDGGRADAGFTGKNAGDCVTRAIAIVGQLPYLDVYRALHERARAWYQTSRSRHARDIRAKGAAAVSRRSSPRDGMIGEVWKPYLYDLGWTSEATMTVGSVLRVHPRHGEVPEVGRYILQLSHHLTAVVDGTLHDLSPVDRDRCVYSIWTPPA